MSTVSILVEADWMLIKKKNLKQQLKMLVFSGEIISFPWHK